MSAVTVTGQPSSPLRGPGSGPGRRYRGDAPRDRKVTGRLQRSRPSALQPVPRFHWSPQMVSMFLKYSKATLHRADLPKILRLRREHLGNIEAGTVRIRNNAEVKHA